MDLTYEVSQLFDLAFGIKSPVFIPYPLRLDVDRNISYGQPDEPEYRDIHYPSMQVKAQVEPERTSWMGTPIVFPWVLKGGTYKQFNSKGELIDVNIDDFEMPAATLVTMEREKIINRTKLSGNEGTVKEMYGFDDWDIKVRGICLTDSSRPNAKTAVEQKQQLLKFERLCSSIKVTGELFFEKNILALSIGRISFTQLEGKPDVLPFEFQCYSDDRIELVS